MASWPGVLDPALLKEEVVARNHRLADAAKAGRWAEVFEVLELSWVSVNQWRLDGDSWFAPLHQAAWHGASTSVVAGLLERGALRSLPTRDGRTARVVEDVIQTDAALNPGNSGGALADSSCRVVGINTAVAGWGLGLAVPMNDTSRRIIAALVEDGRVRRAYLGLVSTPAPLPAALAERTGRRRGLRIIDVVPGAPADRAGLKPGDLVLEADRRPVADAQSLQRLLFAEAIGRSLPMTVYRRGAMVDVITAPAELTGS